MDKSLRKLIDDYVKKSLTRRVMPDTHAANTSPFYLLILSGKGLSLFFPQCQVHILPSNINLYLGLREGLLMLHQHIQLLLLKLLLLLSNLLHLLLEVFHLLLQYRSLHTKGLLQLLYLKFKDFSFCAPRMRKLLLKGSILLLDG